MQLALGVTRTMRIYSTPVALQLIGSQRLWILCSFKGLLPLTPLWSILHAELMPLSLDGSTRNLAKIWCSTCASLQSLWTAKPMRWNRNLQPLVEYLQGLFGEMWRRWSLMEFEGLRGSSRESGFPGRTSFYRAAAAEEGLQLLCMET